MTDRSNDVEKLERIGEQVADSVLGLSDEVIFAEIRESGADPQEAAERIRLLLLRVSKRAEVANVNHRLASGHIGGRSVDGRTKT